MSVKRADRLLRAIAWGEAVGALTDGCSPAAAVTAWLRARDRGWPLRAVDGDPARGGAITARSRALVHAWLAAGGAFGEPFAAAFAAAIARLPAAVRGLDVATMWAATDLAGGARWQDAGARFFAAHPADEPPEPLAPAAVAAVLARDAGEAVAAAKLQCRITHHAPAVLAACAAVARLVHGVADRDVAEPQDPFASPSPPVTARAVLAVARWAAKPAKGDSATRPPGAEAFDPHVFAATAAARCGAAALCGGAAAAATALAAALRAAATAETPGAS